MSGLFFSHNLLEETLLHLIIWMYLGKGGGGGDPTLTFSVRKNYYITDSSYSFLEFDTFEFDKFEFDTVVSQST